MPATEATRALAITGVIIDMATRAPVKAPVKIAPSPCEDCNGAGCVHWVAGPDTHDRERCETCQGTGDWSCDLCGNVIRVTGYDCMACETADQLPIEFSGERIAGAIAAMLRDPAYRIGAGK